MRELLGFANRIDAGRQLADAVVKLQLPHPVVIGLPRGGVPVAAQVAVRLGCPLDVIVVRKVGAPSSPEFALGAISEDGVQVFNSQALVASHLPEAELDALIAREEKSLNARLQKIRARHAQVDLVGKSVIVVDDGIATGSDARAACRVARARGAALVVIAVPVAPIGWQERLAGEADDYLALSTPEDFMAVGQFYTDFDPVSDDEMLRWLDANH